MVIPTRNRRSQLEACVGSVMKSDYNGLEVIVVDDCSDERVEAPLDHWGSRVRVIRNPSRRLLSYSRNVGASASSGDFVFFLDDDNVIATDTITELARTFDLAPGIAVACPVIYLARKPGTVWTSDIRKGRIPGFYILDTAEPVRPVRTFSFHNSFMVRRDVFNDVGGFDSQHFPIHISELDLAYRLQGEGYIAVVNPRAKTWHDVAESHMHVDSSRSFYTLRNRIILLRRYESAGTFWAYTLGVLPPLVAYYVFHHMLSSSDRRFLASYNVLRGVVAGLAMRDIAPRLPRRTDSA